MTTAVLVPEFIDIDATEIRDLPKGATVKSLEERDARDAKLSTIPAGKARLFPIPDGRGERGIKSEFGMAIRRLKLERTVSSLIRDGVKYIAVKNPTAPEPEAEESAAEAAAS